MTAIDGEDRATAHRAQMEPVRPDEAKPNRVEPGHLSAADIRPSLEWSRHDRTHLEMSVDLSLDGQTASSLHWDAYYFIPETFHLNADTYPKHEIFTDIRSYIRLTVPPLSVADIPTTSDQLTGTIAGEKADVAVDELKLFGSRVHRAIVDASIEASGTIGRTRDCDDLDGPHVASQVEAIISEFATSLTLATAGARANLATIGTLAGIDETVSDAANWVDEYMSRSLERAFIRLARHEAELGLKTTTATEAAVAEAQYRQIIRSGPVSAADIGSRSLERIERRAHSLKRYTSSVLWLDIQVRDANRWAEHVLHAVAAGIAMTFTVVVALLYGNPGEAGRLWLWGLLVVLAYMAKDRIKIVLQRVFDAVMADRFSDRRWSVTHPNHNQPVATVSEGAGQDSIRRVPRHPRRASHARRDSLPPQGNPDRRQRHQGHRFSLPRANRSRPNGHIALVGPYRRRQTIGYPRRPQPRAALHIKAAAGLRRHSGLSAQRPHRGSRRMAFGPIRGRTVWNPTSRHPARWVWLEAAATASALPNRSGCHRLRPTQPLRLPPPPRSIRVAACSRVRAGLADQAWPTATTSRPRLVD